jgi:dTDP-4-amino-4,6-dideoxygalactose transaminase
VKVPVASPLASYLAHQDEIDSAIDRVLTSRSYVLGPEVEAFEGEFASYIGRDRAVGVGNGTDAVEIALRACGVGPGDAVITVSHTAVATVAAIELAGATPILVDIDPSTFTLDPGRVESTIRDSRSARIKAVIAVHLYGHPADMVSLMRIAREYDLWLIEDCAQAHGALVDGVRAGGLGDVGTFSFYPTKNLGAIGDGGAVAAGSELAGKVASLRQYGWQATAVSEQPGMNSRLDELQAAILRVKLRHLDDENARRRRLASHYSEILEPTSIQCPMTRPGVEHAFHQYVIRTPRRDELRDHLIGCSVGTGIHYPVPVHLQPGYAGRTAMGSGGLGHTEAASREILSLPVYPQLSDDDVDHVAGLVREWAQR